MTKIAGSGSGSISQKHGSEDPDPPQNVMDPKHWLQVLKTESYHEFESGLVTNSLALCNCFYLADKQGERWQLLVRNVIHYVPVLLPNPLLVVHNDQPSSEHWRNQQRIHNKRIHKVHNMRLRYIKQIMQCLAPSDNLITVAFCCTETLNLWKKTCS